MASSSESLRVSSPAVMDRNAAEEGVGAELGLTPGREAAFARRRWPALQRKPTLPRAGKQNVALHSLPLFSQMSERREGFRLRVETRKNWA